MQFENRYVSNEKIYGEYTRKVLFRGLDRMAMVIFVLAAMLFAFEWMEGEQLEMSAMLMLFSAVIILISGFTGRMAIRNMRKYHGGEIPESRIEFGEKMQLEEGATSTAVEYSKVTHVHNLKHSYVLRCGKAVAVIVAKGKFTVGSEAEFMNFIKEKCPNAKFKR
ncbi:MAG: hypothetical protein IJO98_05230 [Clostridia bacterium]|nr:hypothetical protein [Clostridia bacterium]